MIQGGLSESRLHYGWIVTLMGMLTVIGAHGFGRMAYTVILQAMGGFLADHTSSFASSFLLASGVSPAGGILSLQL